MPTNNPNLPLQFRKSAVERYWPVIHSIIQSWPTPVIIDPKPLSPETFICRLRDAVKAITVYNQGTSHQFELTHPIASDLMVCHEFEKIKAGPRSILRKSKTAGLTRGSVIDAKLTLTTDTFDSPSKTLLDAIFVLLNTNHISHCTISGVDQDTLSQLISTSSRPMELIQNSTNSFTIF